MIEWPQDLVDDIARRRCVLFLGAGVSKGCMNDCGEHPQDWKEFLTSTAQEELSGSDKALVLSSVANGDLLTACEIAKTAMHQDRFTSRLLHEFSEKCYLASDAQKRIVQLDSRIVLTTNFDKTYENIASNILHGNIISMTYRSSDVADALRRRNRYIIKIHGSIDSPSETIFTRSEYINARVHFASFYMLVAALFMTHTFIFVGASLNDPDLRLLLEDYAVRYRNVRPHYVVSPTDAVPGRVREVQEETMNIKVLSYDPSEFHRELTESLGELASRVDDARTKLLETVDW